MEQYVVKGGVPLRGKVSIGGAKNAALGILAAAIMTDDTVTIENVPNVRDTRVLLQAIEGIGAKVKYVYNNSVQINGGSICDTNVEYDYIRKIRASYYLLGALLGKYNEAHVALPGGCNIGSRPIDQHLKGFRALGAEVDIRHGAIVAKAENLHGSHIFLAQRLSMSACRTLFCRTAISDLGFHRNEGRTCGICLCLLDGCTDGI